MDVYTAFNPKILQDVQDRWSMICLGFAKIRKLAAVAGRSSKTHNLSERQEFKLQLHRGGEGCAAWRLP